jgi:predicted dehydrogenase
MTNHKINIAIIGMGKGGQALLKMFADEEKISVLGVVEKRVDAPGIAKALDFGIPVYDDWNVLFANSGLKYIIDVTGDAGVHEALLRDVPRGIDVMSGPSARLIWLLVEARHRAQAELEEEKNLSEGLFE